MGSFGTLSPKPVQKSEKGEKGRGGFGKIRKITRRKGLNDDGAGLALFWFFGP
jgi:hypothetical protein